MSPIEKSADEMDMASQLQEQLNERGLDAVRLNMKPQSHPDFDGDHCLDCEVDIPVERLAMGRIRCTACETVLEKQKKQRGV